ncbi:MAG: glutamine--fructose-6-phosphate transaminase (isomerizing) [Deltaproteobacteria bacterium]|nr:glutamine--fructose-6-phosphate transaminase (isomerizing) [Deltaproteobacteria bacterium]
MCGIVGYIGDREAPGVLLNGLKKLEYRGYDSAGMAILCNGRIELRRSVGKISGLEERIKKEPVSGSVGIGHTRWATHGRPTEENAHPHLEGAVAVVHNGIIENYLELREGLKKQGSIFKSETDTEILAHLINREVKKGLKLEDAVRGALRFVKGSYAIAVISKDEPHKVVGARMECPLIAGIGEGETFLASDALPLLDITRRVVFLDDREVVTLTRGGIIITDLEGNSIAKTPKVIDWSPSMAEKDGYRHFMQKEIFEQPRAVTDTFRGHLTGESNDVFFNDFNIPINDIERIYLIACGTSWHAALVGKFYMEGFSRIPSEVDLASEFRYRDPLVGPNTLIIAISQSGETADTLAAVAEAKRKGAKVIAICNVLESSLTREADFSFMTHAGPEIGVASTKAFTTQLTALYLMAIYIGRKKGRLSSEQGRTLIHELLKLPNQLEKTLDLDTRIEGLALRYFHFRDFLYLGRSVNFPIALEGALKLKEISYIHAEGYAAGEMKHGPIALIDEDMPVVILAPKDESYVKILSNMQEVRARGARVIVFVNEDDTDAVKGADDIVEVPSASKHLTPIVLSIPLQLLAYHIAVLRGTDVDQPRNLAKSVTVE